MTLDLSRYLSLFVQESIEHLENLGQGLVALEKDPKVVDAIFRHAHSVKGMAASMGFMPISEVAHRLEDLFDVARRGEAKLGAPEIDLCLQVADSLGVLVRAAGEGRPLGEAGVDAGALARRLAAARAQLVAGRPDNPALVRSGESPAPSEAPAPAPVAPAPPGTRKYRVIVQVVSSSKVPGVRGFLVHKRLTSLGTVLRSDPSINELKAGRMPGGHLEILLATDAGQESITSSLATISELERVKVEEVAPDPLAPPLGAVPRSENVRTVRIRTDLLDAFMDGVGELRLITERIRTLTHSERAEGPTPLDDAIDQLNAVVKDLNRQVMATRMTPLAVLTDRLPRVVREMARQVGKEVALVVEGSEIELDRAILDEIDSPVTHLLRNCIDHGIEDGETRRAAGKSPEARLRLEASRDRDRVVIEISDDGRGFDRGRLKALAVAAGHVGDRQAESLSDQEVLMLSCLPGLSTKGDVSDLSGRGVGMDAVKAAVEGLGGSLEIQSEAGRGSTFTLRMPLTVAIQRLLLVQAGGETFGLPVGKVVHVTQFSPEKRSTTRGRTMVPFLDQLVPAFDLGGSLELPQQRSGSLHYVVFEGEGRRLAAAAVDGLEGQLEAVIKPLGQPLERLGGLSGVTLLPDGRPLFVLDLAYLSRTAELGMK